MAEHGEQDVTRVRVEEIPKPGALLTLGPVCEALFARLRTWFEIGDRLVVDLSAVDSPTVVAELQDPRLVAGFAMRKLQALHLVSRPGVRTTTDVVVTQIDSVLRALVEAPGRHMKVAAHEVNWDHEWQVLDAGMFVPLGCPEAEAHEFRDLVQRLADARHAVIQASAAEIRVLC